jgi:hypothetical protein
MMRLLLAGATAGALGATALNVVTYLDMVVRGRPPSTTPERTVERLTERVGRPVPGQGETRQHRLSGLGALSGVGTGVAVGAALGALRWFGVRPPRVLGPVLVGLVAMAVADAPMAGLGISDPRRWSTGDWLADAVPHLAYGVATCAALDALDGRRR